MLHLPDSWVWDFWLADDGEDYHLFFLYASRALREPGWRHHRAAIGHAVSRDLTSWKRVADALVRSDSPAFDDRATWTGSVVRDPRGGWAMFYTGLSVVRGREVQRIGLATSADLLTWDKHPSSPILTADPRWYESASDTRYGGAWRDPWVLPDPDGGGWHMLITARSREGDIDDRGVIGYARSPDLEHWESGPPLSRPGAGFGQLEVPQVEIVEGNAVLLFSCARSDMAPNRSPEVAGGTWVAEGKSLLGPFDIASAYPLTDDTLYSGRLVRDRSGQWVLLAFHDRGPTPFVGDISDPMPVGRKGGLLTVGERGGVLSSASPS